MAVFVCIIGKLFTTTVPQLVEYWISLENVRFEYTKEGTVLVNGKAPHTKRVRDDLIVWFTLPPQSMVELSITK